MRLLGAGFVRYRAERENGMGIPGMIFYWFTQQLEEKKGDYV
jgi:hypothetical protein